MYVCTYVVHKFMHSGKQGSEIIPCPLSYLTLKTKL